MGILGGGQLGRMLAIAASRLGYHTVVLDPDASAPAAQLTNDHVVTPYDDPQGLSRLAELCDVVTYEFENVPDAAVELLAPNLAVHPGAFPLSVAQDRLVEKRYLNDAGISTARFVEVNSQDDVVAAVEELGGQAILKTRRFGYDGKGQLRIDAAVPDDAFEQLGNAPLIAEGFVDFSCEISVIGARSADGTTACFDPARNDHHDGILAVSSVPTLLDQSIEEAARTSATALLKSLDYVGVLGLELFVLDDGTLLGNEFAPRVHNSGHWTEAACAVSQFEQHIRAVTGLPLVNPTRHSDCVMQNLIGDQVLHLEEHLANPNCLVHLYGKAEVRPGRKMGHITTLLSLIHI